MRLTKKKNGGEGGKKINTVYDWQYCEGRRK
jgi:hypothetical protein